MSPSLGYRDGYGKFILALGRSFDKDGHENNEGLPYLIISLRGPPAVVIIGTMPSGEGGRHQVTGLFSKGWFVRRSR